MELSKCICGVMGNPGFKCRKCSRTVPELKKVEEVYVEEVCNELCDGACDEDCECIELIDEEED